MGPQAKLNRGRHRASPGDWTIVTPEGYRFRVRTLIDWLTFETVRP